MSAAIETRLPAPHTHACPDCGKLLNCEKAGAECQKFISERLRKYPCRGAQRRRIEASAGTCLHCGETELQPSDMEPLSDGSPSRMCKGCAADYQEKKRLELPALLSKWHEDVKREEREAEKREREGKKSKAVKAQEEVSSHSLYLVK